jgi:hypothetical protein
MSFPLLPSEIQLQIAECLRTDLTALGNWSCTSRHFQSLLAPQFFQSIILRNTEESSITANLVLAKYGRYIKELRFIATAPRNEENDEYESSDVIAIFPQAVEDVLSNLNQIPELETLCIELDIHADLRGFYANYWDDLGQAQEAEEATIESKITDRWRALMAKTFASIARNEKPRFKVLVVKNLLPIEVSTFNTVAFHEFLSHMQRFELYLHGYYNGGWGSGSANPVEDFADRLDVWFFDHLISVTDLTIHAHEEERMCAYESELPITENRLPLLKSLRVKNLFLRGSLAEFLTNHGDTLEVLELDDCFGDANLREVDPANRFFWDGLFISLTEAKPSRLRQLKITPVEVPLPKDDAEEVRRTLEGNDQLRPFPYGWSDDKYGCTGPDEYFNRDRFQSGEDQRAFECLMRIVAANASSYRGSGVR